MLKSVISYLGAKLDYITKNLAAEDNIILSVAKFFV